MKVVGVIKLYSNYQPRQGEILKEILEEEDD